VDLLRLHRGPPDRSAAGPGLPAKNLLAAAGATVAVGCAACYNRLKTANHHIARDKEARNQVAAVLGADYDGQTQVLHLLEILARDVGWRRSRNTSSIPCAA